jgi:nitrogen regulatory protein P-II 1
MKKIEAMIRPEKMDTVRKALEEAGYPGITVTEITGHGMQKGTLQQWKGARYKLEFLPKVKLELICQEEDVEKIIEAILESASTGMLGDGKIFLYDVAEAVRIRTRERGVSALL